MSTQRGQIFRTANGLWAIRFRDAPWPAAAARRVPHAREATPGARGGAAAGAARPAVPAGGDAARARRRVPGAVRGRAVDADVAARQPEHGAATAFGDEPIGELTRRQIAAWRASLPEGKRYRSHRALRQVLPRRCGGGGSRTTRRRSSRTRRRSRARSTRSTWDEIERSPPSSTGRTARCSCSCAARACGRRRRSAPSGRDVDLEGGMFTRAPRVREGPAEDVRQDRSLAAARPAAREGRRRAQGAAEPAAASCSRARRAAGSTSTTGASATGLRRSKRPGSSTGGSTTCGTRSRRGAWRPG